MSKKPEEPVAPAPVPSNVQNIGGPFYERSVTVPIIVFSPSPVAPHTGLAIVKLPPGALNPLAPGDMTTQASIRLARARNHDDGPIMVPLCAAELGEVLDENGRYPLRPHLDPETVNALKHGPAVDELVAANPEEHVLVAQQVQQARATVEAIRSATHALFRVRFWRSGQRGIPPAAAPFIAPFAALFGD